MGSGVERRGGSAECLAPTDGSFIPKRSGVKLIRSFLNSLSCVPRAEGARQKIGFWHALSMVFSLFGALAVRGGAALAKNPILEGAFKCIPPKRRWNALPGARPFVYS